MSVVLGSVVGVRRIRSAFWKVFNVMWYAEMGAGRDGFVM